MPPRQQERMVRRKLWSQGANVDEGGEEDEEEEEEEEEARFPAKGENMCLRIHVMKASTKAPAIKPTDVVRKRVIAALGEGSPYYAEAVRNGLRDAVGDRQDDGTTTEDDGTTNEDRQVGPCWISTAPRIAGRNFKEFMKVELSVLSDVRWGELMSPKNVQPPCTVVVWRVLSCI